MVARRLTFALVFGVLAGRRVGAQMPPVDSIKSFLARGNYVFEALLLRKGVTADSILPASEQTVVARVTQVFACPREVGNFTGDFVTLFEPGPHAAVGTRSWYFGSGWAIGGHVAARVLHRVDGLGDTDSSAVIASLRAAVRLKYEEAIREAARASDSVVIATFGTTQSVMIDLVPLRTEHAERWARLNVTLDSIRVRRADSSGKFVAAWVPPTNATRQAGILIPYEIAYDGLGRPRMPAGPPAHLLFFERLSDRPNLVNLDKSAAGFIPDSNGIRPFSDVAFLGSALPMPTFTLAPVQECAQPGR